MKLQCLKCGDIIEGDKKGGFIQCSCKEVFIDETKWYCRWGGSPKYVLDPETGKTMYEIMSKQYKKEEEKEK